MSQAERVPISKRLVLLNAGAAIGTRLLTIAVFGWALRVLIHRVSKEELALLPVVLSVGFLAPVFQSVLTAGLSRFVTEAYARGDTTRVTQIVSSLFPLLLAAAAAICALGGLIAWQAQDLLGIDAAYLPEARLMLLLLFGRIAIGVALSAHSTGVVTKQEFVRKSAIEILGSIVQVALLITLFNAFGAEVEYVVVAQVAAQVLVLAATCWLSMRLLPELKFRRSAIHLPTGLEVVQYGGWYTLQQLAATIRRAADAPILKRLATSTDVTAFFLASFIEDNLRNLINVASQPVLPALTAMHATGQHSRLAAVYLRGGRISTWIALLAAIPLCVFAEDLFRAYLGEQYESFQAATPALRLLLLGFVATYPGRMIFQLSAAIGNVRPVAKVAIAIAVFNLFATLLLVGPFQLGAIGSAASTGLSFLILTPLLTWPIAVRELGVSWSQFLWQTLVPALTPAAVSLAVGFVYLQIDTHPSVHRLLVGAPLVLFVYLIALAVVLKKADRSDLKQVARVFTLRRTGDRSPSDLGTPR